MVKGRTATECWLLLEVPQWASEKQCKDQYRLLCKVWHPDRYSNDPSLKKTAEEKLKIINDAYHTLKKLGFPRKPIIPPHPPPQQEPPKNYAHSSEPTPDYETARAATARAKVEEELRQARVRADAEVRAAHAEVRAARAKAEADVKAERQRAARAQAAAEAHVAQASAEHTQDTESNNTDGYTRKDVSYTIFWALIGMTVLLFGIIVVVIIVNQNLGNQEEFIAAVPKGYRREGNNLVLEKPQPSLPISSTLSNLDASPSITIKKKTNKVSKWWCRDYSYQNKDGTTAYIIPTCYSNKEICDSANNSTNKCYSIKYAWCWSFFDEESTDDFEFCSTSIDNCNLTKSLHGDPANAKQCGKKISQE